MDTELSPAHRKKQLYFGRRETVDFGEPLKDIGRESAHTSYDNQQSGADFARIYTQRHMFNCEDSNQQPSARIVSQSIGTAVPNEGRQLNETRSTFAEDDTEDVDIIDLNHSVDSESLSEKNDAAVCNDLRTASLKDNVAANRVRTAYNSIQILNLEREFTKNMYLSRIRRIELAQKLDLSEKQVKIWFQNRRVKYKKDNLRQEQKVNRFQPQETSSESRSS